MASIHDDRGSELLAIIWIFTVLAVITVSLKIFTRAQILHALGVDDIFIFISLVKFFRWQPYGLFAELRRH